MLSFYFSKLSLIPFKKNKQKSNVSYWINRLSWSGTFVPNWLFSTGCDNWLWMSWLLYGFHRWRLGFFSFGSLLSHLRILVTTWQLQLMLLTRLRLLISSLTSNALISTRLVWNHYLNWSRVGVKQLYSLLFIAWIPADWNVVLYFSSFISLCLLLWYKPSWN